MGPPALVIAGSIVVVVGATVAFHQFVYEPHIAPKLHEWIEKQRIKRRHLAPAVYHDGDSDEEDSSDGRGTSHFERNFEMKDISVPLKITGYEVGVSDATLRKRLNASPLEKSLNLKTSDEPLHFGIAEKQQEPVSASRSSTPSTVSSSVLAAQSPLVVASSPPLSPVNGTRNPDPLADSILANSQFSFSVPSPTRSITHISPRAVFVPLPRAASPINVNNPYPSIEFTDSEDEDDRPLSEFTPQRDTAINYPVLTPSTRVARSTSSSPTGSTVYESFAPTPLSTGSRSPITVPQELEESNSAFLMNSHHFSNSDAFLSPGQRTPLTSGQHTPHSNASWSEAALSERGDEPDFLVGSDVESWANVSDMSRGSRSSRI